jgi:hypothetical protein
MNRRTKKAFVKKSDTITLSEKTISSSNLRRLLKKYFKDIPFNGEDTFLNVPVELYKIQLDEYSRLGVLLNTSIKKIVVNYFTDERIKKKYRLDEDLETILRRFEKKPYEVGLYRPDIVLDKNGQSKICEIGCRYPINGWMISYTMNCIMEELASTNNCNWNAIPGQIDFISVLSKDLDDTKPLCYVHDLEGGTEAYQFLSELKKKGFSVIDISPDKLEITKGEFTVNGEIVTQFIIEMDREELKKIKPEILQKLIESEKCLNDLRTLILVHDKRILSVLYDEQIMCDYINSEDYDFLKRFLIPSYTLDSERKRNYLINSTSNWVLKKNSGGRGIGIYVKNDCTPEKWKEVVTKEWKDYMVQEYIDQKIFELEDKDKRESVNIVGMLLCYNAQSFGPGVFRGSSKSIINVHSGGYILPSVVSNLL